MNGGGHVGRQRSPERSRRGHEAVSRTRRAFTLLEVLLAVSVGAMLLVSVIGFAYSMTELWGNTSEPRLFAQHVRGVSRFLDNMLRQAEPPPEISALGEAESAQPQQNRQNPQSPPQPRQGGGLPGMNPGGASGGAGDLTPVAWQRPRGRQYGTDEFLTFELAESPGIFAWPQEPLPFVVCALRVDPGEGLFLLWKSRLEEDFEEEAPREFRVSPYVTGITYYYYDTEGAQPKWEKTEQPRRTGGELELPARIELTFEYKSDKITTALVIPPATSAVPVY